MSIFKFKYFSVYQSKSVHPIGTDSMILGALVSSNQNATSILDIGTGSGVLALMCAQRFPKAKIVGIDIDSKSIDVAHTNFEQSRWSSRLISLKSSLSQFKSECSFDVIVSNPPFYEETYHSPNTNRVRQRNSKSLPLMELITQSAELLSTTGSIWLILPYRRKEESEQLFEQAGLSVRKEITLFGKPFIPIRIIFEVGFETDIHQRLSSSITVRKMDGTYSEKYKELTKDFHDRPL